MYRSSGRGFTLIELLVVIAIIGILSAIVSVSLGDARNRGNEAGVRRSLIEARTQAEFFYQANGNRYSVSINDTTTNVCNASALVNETTGLYDILKNAANVAGVPQTNIRTCVVGNPVSGGSCTGAAGYVTCHACPPEISVGNCSGLNSNAWAVEVPLKDNLAPTENPDFWCIDSSGFNGRNSDGSRLSTGDARCL